MNLSVVPAPGVPAHPDDYHRARRARALYAAHAPAGLELDELAILGPISVLKLKFAPAGYDRKLVAEL